MPLWGQTGALPKQAANTSAPSVRTVVGFPGALAPGQSALSNTYATANGWTQTLPSKPTTTKTELLVETTNLCNVIGASQITCAFFSPPTFDANANVTLTLAWNKTVTMNGVPTTNINVTMNGSSAQTNVLVNYIGGNNTNQLRFGLTANNDLQGNTGYFGNGTVIMMYSLPSWSTVNIGSGILQDVTNAGFSSGRSANNLAWGWPFTGIQPTGVLVHQIPLIANISFANTRIANGVASNVYVNFTGNVTVRGDRGTANLLIAASNGIYNLVATYASGNGTSNLRYSFTPAANTTNLAITSGSAIWLGGPLTSFANGNVNVTITAAISNTAGVCNVV